MIKASAGGGGKGMRIAWNDEETKWEDFNLTCYNYNSDDIDVCYWFEGIYSHLMQLPNVVIY